jgi:hypothetical protein
MSPARPLHERAYAALARRKPDSYWARVQKTALALKSDGCSVVTQAYKLACYEHDIHYRTGQTLWGAPISREQADALFPTRIRQMAWDGLGWNPLTWYHLIGFPMSAWRWAGVRIGGAWSYNEAS